MKVQMVLPKKISPEGACFDFETFLLVAALLIPFTFYVVSIDRTSEAVTHGTLQEKIGHTIAAVARWDLDREAQILKQRANVLKEIRAFESTRMSRWQEVLGMAITRRSLRIFEEEARLKQSLNSVSEEFRRFRSEKASRWQEQVGMAAVAAYRRSVITGEEFMPAFDREVARLKAIEDRRARRLESQLNTLKAKEIQFRHAVPLMYEESIDSARRSVRMLEASLMSHLRQTLNGLESDLAWERQPEDYTELAGLTRQVLAGFRGVGGFMEYGLAALIGLLLAVVWAAYEEEEDTRYGKNLS
jgi:hypothetical protein